jgi:capsule polysaccharide export protein KpsE/RkpR
MLSVTPRLLLDWAIKDIWKIIFISIIFSIISVFYVLSIPNIYSSKAVVSSNMSDSKSMGGTLSKLGGLASLAGISLGGGQLSPEVLKEMITSKSFLASFIRKYHLEVDIMAAKGYQPNNKKFIYDEKIYDNKNHQWVRKFKYPQSLIPSDIELVEKFNEFFSVSYARKTKLITLNFKFYTPDFAKKTLNNLISHFNEYMKNTDIHNSETSIEYLKLQLKKAKYNEVKLSLQQIMEEQFKKLAVAKTRKEYALRVIDAPMVAAKKSEPKRAIICLLITLFGTFFSVITLWSLRILKN